MIVRLIFIAVLSAAFTATQAIPVYPYGPYGYPYPMPYAYGVAPIAAYPYGATFLRNYHLPGVQTANSVPTYYNIPTVGGTVPLGMMQRNFQDILRSMSKMNRPKTAYHDVVGTNDGNNSMMRNAGMNSKNAASHQTEYKGGNLQFGEAPSQQEFNGRDYFSASYEPKESSSKKAMKPREGQDFSDSMFSNRRSHNEMTIEDDNTNLKARDVQEITGNTLELEEEYQQKRERETEWDQSNYENVDWEDANDIDGINVYNGLPQRQFNVKGDTYRNELLAAKRVAFNPDAKLIPLRDRANGQEIFEYQDLTIPSRQQPHYHGDTRVNDILAARNAPINPDAEFIPPHSKFSKAIKVHYDYDIDDDEDTNKPKDFTHDRYVNDISAAQGAPVNPNAEILNFGHKKKNANTPSSRNRGEYSGDTHVNRILKKQGARTNPDAEIVDIHYREDNRPKEPGQYSGDTYVNEVMAKAGATIHPDAEIFTPADEVIEFVPLESEEFYFKNDLRGDININKIAEERRVEKNPDAEEFDPTATRQRSRK